MKYFNYLTLLLLYQNPNKLSKLIRIELIIITIKDKFSIELNFDL